MSDIVFETAHQTADRHPALTVYKVRHYIRNADRNGLREAGGVTKVGKRFYLIQPYFDRWLASDPMDPQGWSLRLKPDSA